MTLNPADLGYYEKRPGSGIWYKPGVKTGREPRTCQKCGGEFMAQRGNATSRGRGMYCSLRCRDAAFGTVHEPRPCENCGDVFRPSHLGGRFCSKACAGIAKRSDSVGYWGAHNRVGKARGKARDHLCADCGRQAFEWSQVHGTTGQEPEDYEPRCQKCHRAYDAPTRTRGERSPSARLTEQQVRAMLWSTETRADLAAKHGVSLSTVHLVLKRRVWKHVAYYDWPQLWEQADKFACLDLPDAAEAGRAARALLDAADRDPDRAHLAAVAAWVASDPGKPKNRRPPRRATAP